MAEHTPEPWGAEEGPITLHGKQWSLLSPVDYERARACVNACAGMPLADVQELASIPGGVMALTVKTDDYRAERDSMRAERNAIRLERDRLAALNAELRRRVEGIVRRIGELEAADLAARSRTEVTSG